MTDIDDLKTMELEDVTDEQRMKKYRCPSCSWVGTISEMVELADCSDEYDAIYSPFCCPNKGCWGWYLFLEYWEIVDE